MYNETGKVPSLPMCLNATQGFLFPVNSVWKQIRMKSLLSENMESYQRKCSNHWSISDTQQFSSRPEAYYANLFPTSKPKISHVTLFTFLIGTTCTLKPFCYFWKRVIKSWNTYMFYLKNIFLKIGNIVTWFQLMGTEGIEWKLPHVSASTLFAFPKAIVLTCLLFLVYASRNIL